MARKRGNQYQGDFQHRGQRFRCLFALEHEAIAWEQLQLSRVKVGLPVEFPGKAADEPRKAGRPKALATVGALIDDHITHHWAVECVDGLKSERVRRARKLIAFFGPNRLVEDAFSLDGQKELRDALLAHGNANATVNLHLRALRTLAKRAVEIGVLDKYKVPMMPQVRKKIEVVTEEQEKHYLATAGTTPPRAGWPVRSTPSVPFE